MRTLRLSVAGMVILALLALPTVVVFGQYPDREGLRTAATEDPAVTEVLSRPHERFGTMERPHKYMELTRARSEYREFAIGPDSEIWVYDTMGAGGPLSVWQAGVPGRHKLPGALSDIHDLAVTGDGTLWAATQNGLASFDGKGWTRHWAKSGMAGLDVAPDGSLVAVGSGSDRSRGITVLRVGEDGLSDESVAGPTDAEGWRVSPDAVVATPGGHVWVGGNGLVPSGWGWGFGGPFGPFASGAGFLARYDGEVLETMSPFGGDGPDDTLLDVSALAMGPDGSVWAIVWRQRSPYCMEPYLARHDGQDWTLHSLDDGLPARIGNSLAVDSAGTVWISLNLFHESGGVASFDGETFTTYLPDSRPWEIAVAPDDTVWWTSEVAMPEVGLESFAEVGLRAIVPAGAAPLTTD